MPSPVVRFRCPPDLRDRIDAARGDESLSGWVKDAIRQRLNGGSGGRKDDAPPTRLSDAARDLEDVELDGDATEAKLRRMRSTGADRPPTRKGHDGPHRSDAGFAPRDGRPRCSDHPLAVVLAGRCGVCNWKVT